MSSTEFVVGKRHLFGNEGWLSHRAIVEIEIYCDLLDNVQERIDSLEVRGKGEEAALVHVQAFISSYALEIAIKSFWALDYSDKKVPHKHNLLDIFDELKETTRKSLELLHFNREELKELPEPFYTNRYSMEHSGKDLISVHDAGDLRSLAKLLEEKLKQTTKALLSAH